MHSGYAKLFVGLVLMAMGFSVFVPASTEAIMTAAPKESAGGASAINQTTRQLGQALGIGIGGSLAASGYRSGFVTAGLRLDPKQLHTAGSSITGAITVAKSLATTSRDAVLRAADQAFLHGTRWSLLTAAVLACSAGVFAALAVPSRHASPYIASHLPRPDQDGVAVVDDPVPDVVPHLYDAPMARRWWVRR